MRGSIPHLASVKEPKSYTRLLSVTVVVVIVIILFFVLSMMILVDTNTTTMKSMWEEIRMIDVSKMTIRMIILILVDSVE